MWGKSRRTDALRKWASWATYCLSGGCGNQCNYLANCQSPPCAWQLYMTVFHVPFSVPLNEPIACMPFGVPFTLPLAVPFHVPLNVPFIVPFAVPFSMPFVNMHAKRSAGKCVRERRHGAHYRRVSLSLSGTDRRKHELACQCRHSDDIQWSTLVVTVISLLG